MRYLDSITDFFKSPQWMMNLLLGGLCVLIPIVGPIALQGWHITGFWMQPVSANRSEAAHEGRRFVDFPRFQFEQFVEYLQRGLWPFLVVMVLVFVVVIVMQVVMFGFIASMVMGAQQHGQQQELTIAQGISIGIMGIMYLIAIVGLNFIQVPLALRATLVQDFAPAFNLAFLRQFIGLMWVEMLGSVLFLMVVGIPLILCGFLAFCVGVYVAASLMLFSVAHLHQQMYQLYLARGGAPVPMSPKLLLSNPPPVPLM